MIPATLRGSLRLRLLLGTLLWIAGSILFAGWGLGKLFRQHVEAQFHAELKTHLDQLTAQLTLDEKGRPALALPPSDPRLNKPFAGLYWQIDRLASADHSAAAAVLRSRSLWDQILQASTNPPGDGELRQQRIVGPEGRMLGMVERRVVLDETPLRLIVAADESLMMEPVVRFNDALWLSLGALGLGLALAALVQVIVGLAPLRSLQAALGRVREGAAPRMEGGFPTEIMPLVEEFNTVLAQNAEVIERARTQAGNLAHALKTPLSVLANAAGGGDDDGDRAELARLVLDQVGIVRRQVDYHLARAQAAATVRIPGARTPLQPAIDGLLRTMRRIHAERRIELTVRPFPQPLSFRGEAHDLQEMLGNLIDNACKWASARVVVAAASDGNLLAITIDDDGAGLAPEQRTIVLRRGVRVDEQVPGSGLGLAIVDDLARLYGGRIELADSPLGGVRAVLTLPAAEERQ